MAYSRHTALIYNLTGQELEFYPPTAEAVAFGAPASAASYRVWGGTQANDDTPLFTGIATVDSTSQTVQNTVGPAAADRSVVQVTSTSGMKIGRRYLLTNAATNGSQRVVVVPKLIATTTISHESDILSAFVPGSTLVGLRQSFVIDATFIATQSRINMFGGTVGRVFVTDAGDTDTLAPPYRVEWTYTTADGLGRKHWTTFDVCRAPLRHGVTIEHVKASMPDVVWMEWTQQQGMEFQPQIEEAFQRFVYDVRMAGYDPNMVTDPQVVDRLVTLGARACIANALDKDPAGQLDAAYVTAFQKAIGTGLKAWMSIDSSGAVAISPARQLWLSR